MTDSDFPKTSHLRLAEWRIAEFVTGARETFRRSCLARVILTQPSAAASEGGYRKFGFNNIVDRIWFVDGTFGDVVYGTPSGAPYGGAVAEAETEHALEKLLESASQNEANTVIETPSEPTEAEVLGLLERVREHGFAPTTVVASVTESLRFWEFRSFAPSREARSDLITPEGHLQGVPVHHCRLLPDGVILASDKTELGVLEVKQDFDLGVTDIPENDEWERIRREVPSLSDANFDEKVRVKGFEVVKATIRQPAFALIKTHGTAFQLKKYV